MPDIAQLPYLDEHAVEIRCDAQEVWDNLLETLGSSFSGAAASAFARLVGCAEHEASGLRPLAEGSAVTGFRVVTAVPTRELVLAGRHRFSTYALIFRLEELGPERSRLRAESRAMFPGLPGAAYRLLVVGTGGHVIGMRRLLSAIRARSERPRHPAD